jgi:hypothetical protein
MKLLLNSCLLGLAQAVVPADEVTKLPGFEPFPFKM